ncbi:MAG: transposase [Opitutaceae bacterium]
MPKGKKHTPEQIGAILRRLERGETAEAVCRSVSLSEATRYRWNERRLHSAFGAAEPKTPMEVCRLRIALAVNQ